MANTGRPNSGGSQFFLNVANNKNLDWFSGGSSKHPVFGKVIEGMDIANKISKVKTVRDNPVVPIMMKSVKINRTPGETREKTEL
jgi:cyclophilin family peptidyl-prolyl cis-trans isomerase